MKFIPPTKDEWAFFLLFCKSEEEIKECEKDIYKILKKINC